MVATVVALMSLGWMPSTSNRDLTNGVLSDKILCREPGGSGAPRRPAWLVLVLLPGLLAAAPARVPDAGTAPPALGTPGGGAGVTGRSSRGSSVTMLSSSLLPAAVSPAARELLLPVGMGILLLASSLLLPRGTGSVGCVGAPGSTRCACVHGQAGHSSNCSCNTHKTSPGPHQLSSWSPTWWL